MIDKIINYTIYAFENQGFSLTVCKYKNYKFGTNSTAKKTHEIRKKIALANMGQFVPAIGVNFTGFCNLVDGTSRQAIFVEKFGHTQIWVINNADGLDEIWNNLPKRSPKN